MVDDQLKNWYQKHFRKLREDPPSEVWENIEASLGGEGKRGRASFWVSTLLMLAVLGGGATWFFMGPLGQEGNGDGEELQDRLAEKRTPTKVKGDDPNAQSGSGKAGNGVLGMSGNEKKAPAAPSRAGSLEENAGDGPKKTNFAREKEGTPDKDGPGSKALGSGPANKGEGKQDGLARNGSSENSEKEQEKGVDEKGARGKKGSEGSGASSFSRSEKADPDKLPMADARVPDNGGKDGASILPLAKEDPGRGKGSLEKNILPQGFYVGGSGNFSNTWILNQETYESFRDESLSETVLNYEAGFGTRFGINVSDATSYEMEVNLNRIKGHRYNRYQNGEFVQSKIELNYFQVRLLYLTKNAQLTFENDIPYAFSFHAGPYFGHLQNAIRKSDKETRSLDDQFKRFDLGVDIGFGYEVYPWKRFRVSLSLHNSLSIGGIYKGKGEVMEDLENTRNFTVEGRFGMAYMLNEPD